jgi:hypothetical protein
VNESCSSNNSIFKINTLEAAFVIKSSRVEMDMNHIQKVLSQCLHIASIAAVTIHEKQIKMNKKVAFCIQYMIEGL